MPYHSGSRDLQDRFDTRRLADRIDERIVHPTIDEDDRELVVRVEANEGFPNCPRYIHEYRLVQRSRFVPHEECATPVPAWKTRDWARDVLRQDDPAYQSGAEVIER